MIKFISGIFFLMVITATAQSNRRSTPVSFDAHLGFGGGTSGISIITGINTAYGNNGIQLRYMASISGLAPSFTFDGEPIKPASGIADFAIMYTNRKLPDERNGSGGLSAGVGYVFGSQYKKDENEPLVYSETRISTYGLALKAEYIKPIFRIIGFGASANANINLQRSFVSLTVTLHAGKLY